MYYSQNFVSHEELVTFLNATPTITWVNIVANRNQFVLFYKI